MILKTTVHLIIFLHHIFGNISGAILLSNFDYSSDANVREMKFYWWGMLTNWNFTFQTLYLALALFHDWLEWSKGSQTPINAKIKFWKDIVFCSLVFPVTCFVSSMFWSLYAIDRELVFPTIYDDVVPWWFNHCVHTNILFLVTMETILEPRTKPRDRKLETILIWSVNMCYTAVYYSVYIFANRWLYHIFAILNWWQLILYQLLIWFSAYFYYLLQYPISQFIHKNNSNEVIKEKIQIKNFDEDQLRDECDMKPINLKYRL